MLQVKEIPSSYELSKKDFTTHQFINIQVVIKISCQADLNKNEDSNLNLEKDVDV